ncbi:MAG: selenide, water dikinase SelD [Pseudooceanicola sp.]|nr:selenide, water dikinase SelD [Pseudooceanicola sp.]
MNGAPLPLTHDIVLIGGGHTHALVLRRWGMSPLAGARLTLITPEPTATYSGMLPGHIAGHYPRAALDIDLVRLARHAGARLIFGAAEGVDREARQIHVPGRPPIGYDLCALDIGVTSAMPALPGFSEHAVPAKPLGPFAARWQAFCKGSGPAQVVVIGAGVAGAELALAMAHALRQRGRAGGVTLVDSADALAATGPRARHRLLSELTQQGVTLIEQAQIAEITGDAVTLADGRSLPADFISGAAGARPAPWLHATGLHLTDGFVTVDAQLQTSDPTIWATGDCAHLSHAPRPKAGVFAVREAPVLFHNLRAALTTARPRRYHPQSDYLKLISLGRKSALADRFGLAPAGRLMWCWKDRIDQRFMARFSDLPKMPRPKLPRNHTSALAEAVGDAPMCGGCGAKVGRDTLRAALGTPRHHRPDITPLPGDDAALMTTGTVQQVMTSDHLRALTDDPVLMTRIAAHHALGDIWAMAAQPQAATATLILPRQSEPLMARQLSEIMATAHEVLRAAGAEIVGGHTSVGDELTIGFTLTGLCPHPPVTLKGARPGDRLILTKPIGSGVLMAGEMQRRASGADVAAAYAQMTHSQGTASALLAHAHAMTDVTGFGLAGHLLNICDAAGCAATLTLSPALFLPGAEALARAGIRSTLYPQNRAQAPYLPGLAAPDDVHRIDLLFDPQTAGGLLAAVHPDTAQPTLAALLKAGYPALLIGTIADGPPRLTIAPASPS